MIKIIVLGNSKNLFAIGVFRDFQHRYTYVLIKIKVILITESNRLVIDTPIDYIKKRLYTKTMIVSTHGHQKKGT